MSDKGGDEGDSEVCGKGPDWARSDRTVSSAKKQRHATWRSLPLASKAVWRCAAVKFASGKVGRQAQAAGKCQFGLQLASIAQAAREHTNTTTPENVRLCGVNPDETAVIPTRNPPVPNGVVMLLNLLKSELAQAVNPTFLYCFQPAVVGNFGLTKIKSALLFTVVAAFSPSLTTYRVKFVCPILACARF
ncbi:hypothetical protein LXL04_019453 [Taraxacum kok-saghyz]